jgi:hypothetical protein
MDWLALSYSLPSKASSSPRVTLWRRLRRLGAVSVAGGPQILPPRDECSEAFGWLAQEIRQAGGQAVVMRVQHFAGLSDAQLIELFQSERATEYDTLDREAAALEKALKTEDPVKAQDVLGRLVKRFNEIDRVDYFGCPTGPKVAARLTRIKQTLSPAPPPAAVEHARVADYQGRHWVTRPRPHVDRLSCAWLIRRFIDSAAPIRYSLQPAPDEVTFDTPDAHFGHRGGLCTFEAMRLAFGLGDPGLSGLAEVVHEIDLHDGLYARPEVGGVEAVLTGWLATSLTDAELETHGIALFEGLYATLSSQPRLSPQTTPQVKKKTH